MNKEITKVPLKFLVADPNQPRQEFDQGELEKLEQSISRQGVLVPLAVERMENGRYLLIDGERRFRASTKVGLKEVPVIIYEAMNDQERIMKRFHLQEQHSNWTPFDKAKAIVALKAATGLNSKEIADLLGLNIRTVNGYASLLELSKRSIELANKNKIQFTYLQSIAGTVRIIDDINLRRELEKALLDKVLSRVVVKNSQINSYAIAIKEGGKKVVEKIITREDYGPKQALNDAGVAGAIEHKKMMAHVSYIANMLEKGKARKTNKDISGEDVARLQRLSEAVSAYLE